MTASHCQKHIPIISLNFVTDSPAIGFPLVKKSICASVNTKQVKINM